MTPAGAWALRALWLLSAFAAALPPVRVTSQMAQDPVPARLVACGTAETRCWDQGKLLHSDGACYHPLEQGSCQGGEWLTLDINSTSPSLRGRCAAPYCAAGQLPSGWSCALEEQAVMQLCGSSAARGIHLNALGLPRCGAHPGWVTSLHEYVQCRNVQFRRVKRQFFLGPEKNAISISTNGVPCTQTNSGLCPKETHGMMPSPLLKPESLVKKRN